MMICKFNAEIKKFLFIFCLFLLHIRILNCQLIKLDGQKTNTYYILYVLKGLYIYGKDDSPYVILGKKKDMEFKEPHAIFENIGVSTIDNRNTKYFSFEMEKNKDEEKNGNNKSNERKNDDTGDNDVKNKKEKFKISLYKDNPYLRRKTEYEYSKDTESLESSELFLELIIMKEKDFSRFYLPKDSDVCCQMQEVGIDENDKYVCPEKGYLKRYVNEDNMYSMKLPVYFINDRIKSDHNASSEMEVNQEQFLNKIKNNFVYNIKDTDIYALFLSNCQDGKNYELYLHGNIHILNQYGYLPGDKISKLNLYFSCMIIYSIYLLTWIYLLIRNKNFVIKIQIWILVCIFLYLMENFFLFLYFLVYNLYAKVNNNLLLLSVFSSILKNVCSYLLILLGSLGWGLVIPTLDKITFIKIKVLFFFFIIFDFIKQFIDLHFSDSQINTIYFFFCIIPVTIIYCIIYIWVFTSTSKIIIQLNEDKQYEKLNMFKTFFNVLIFTIIFSIISFFIDIMVIVYIDNTFWSLKCYISEGIISFLFLIILTAMMILFKPSDRLKRISHFTEIGDMDEMEDFSNFKNVVEDVS
ncbi:serpentine receptor, putative [Plasmodium relictum]|uniref:Serpentine receptor, putative n=1 Tax=Plasmodium relictum TaxID=85471 RepID=A0A1J1HAY4_PLARL|nr:serpentine receptor, putative [Plasmodium relictum]CRH02588.1 serpentine receptor, putative [Plasmodium relictum]